MGSDSMMMYNRFLQGTVALSFLAGCATSPASPAPVVASAPQTPAAPVYELSDIVNVRAEAIDALLGPATLSRKEGAGEYRRYSLSQCTLIVILYPDDTGAQRAAHAEATAKISGEEKPDVRACLAAG